jgi:hypothetical protein
MHIRALEKIISNCGDGDIKITMGHQNLDIDEIWHDGVDLCISLKPKDVTGSPNTQKIRACKRDTFL